MLRTQLVTASTSAQHVCTDRRFNTDNDSCVHVRVQEEEEYLIDLMREEEAAGKRRQDAAREAARREASKQEMIAANAALLALKAQREAQQRVEEEVFRAAMMAQFAEDDRIEQLNAQKRRLKVRRHTHVPKHVHVTRRCWLMAQHEPLGGFCACPGWCWTGHFQVCCACVLVCAGC